MPIERSTQCTRWAIVCSHIKLIYSLFAIKLTEYVHFSRSRTSATTHCRLYRHQKPSASIFVRTKKKLVTMWCALTRKRILIAISLAVTYMRVLLILCTIHWVLLSSKVLFVALSLLQHQSMDRVPTAAFFVLVYYCFERAATSRVRRIHMGPVKKKAKNGKQREKKTHFFHIFFMKSTKLGGTLGERVECHIHTHTRYTFEF